MLLETALMGTVGLILGVVLGGALVAWLGSGESKDVSGCVFALSGGEISIADGWRTGPKVDKGARWEPDEVGAADHDLDYELLELTKDKSVLLEEYAREMIVTEEQHLDEVNKMLRKPGDTAPFKP